MGARVDGNCQGNSYYVTDGGATENLSLVSALYELRGVLDAWQKAAPKAKDGKPIVPPQIDIIAIEAPDRLWANPEGHRVQFPRHQPVGCRNLVSELRHQILVGSPLILPATPDRRLYPWADERPVAVARSQPRTCCIFDHHRWLPLSYDDARQH